MSPLFLGYFLVVAVEFGEFSHESKRLHGFNGDISEFDPYFILILPQEVKR